MRISAKVALTALFVFALLLVGIIPGIARDKYETIDATAWGTSTQTGANIGVTVIIYEFSNADDRSILVQAYKKAQNQGLVNALTKMKAVGRVSITGTLGYDLSYIKQVPIPNGRRIIFVTNRKITFAEDWADSESKSFDLTAGQIDINEQDKSKSSGVLFPATQLVLNSQGELQWDLNQNPWRLGDVIDWKGTPGLN